LPTKITNKSFANHPAKLELGAPRRNAELELGAPRRNAELELGAPRRNAKLQLGLWMGYSLLDIT